MFLGQASASATADESFTPTQASCEAFAATFANTCTSRTAQLAYSAIPSVPLACTDTDKCGDGGTESGNTCTFNRKLCVTCYTENSDVYIHVQTNTIPSHCWYSRINDLNEKEVDYTVKWMSNNFNDNTYTEQGALNEFICNIMGGNDNNIPAGCDYTNNVSGEDKRALGTAWGIATSGVPLFTAFALSGADVFYPAAFVSTQGLLEDPRGAVEGADTCLWHPSPQYTGHYHSPPPCLANPSLVDTKANYMGDVKTYMETEWLNIPYQSVLGVSKDGRPIYTPYNGDGQKRENCDVDICNGFTDGAGNYAYQSTFHHPYFLGCYGKGNSPNIYHQCSANPRLCGVLYLDGAVAGISSFLMAAASALAFTLY